MKTKYIISALVALAGLAAGAHAATVSSAIPDLVIGFQQSGNSNDYEADLGSMSNYVGLTSPTLINLSGDISLTDLNSIFGGSALTSDNVTLGAVATVGASSATLNGVSEAAKTDWVTQLGGTTTGLADTNVSAPASAYAGKAALSGGNTRYQQIQQVNAGLNNQTALSTPNAAQVATSTSGSWTAYANGSSNNFAAGLDSGTQLNLASGTYEYLNLYQYGVTAGAPGVYVGSIELGANGSLDFTNYIPTAIPEPSVYAAILGAATLAFVAIRRRKQQILA
jgi:hypothetical protein